MSRRTSYTPTRMGPPPPMKDVVMGPPPVPQAALHAAALKPRESKENADEVAGKYSRLKRKYYELQERFDDLRAELQRSGERNVRITDEKRSLFDRIVDLEDTRAGKRRAPAIPASLAAERDQEAFAHNLQQATREVRTDDRELDPVYASAHAGPHVRRREADAARARAEEEAQAREAGKGRRRARTKGKEREKERELGPPLAYTPLRAAASAAPPPPPPAHQQQEQPRVSASGTRLRIKPPAPPDQIPSPGEPHHAPPGAQHPQHYAAHPPPPPPPGPQAHGHHGHQHPGYGLPPGSPAHSPLLSPHDQRSPYPGGPSPLYRRDSLGSGGTPPYPQGGGGGPDPRAPPGDSGPRQAKPKRLKAHTVTSKSHSIPTIPRDKQGRPLLPLNVGIMQVHNLGTVCMREHFHTERYIFPVGYEVSRRYLSTIDPNAEVIYHCTILDGGDGPKFQIVASDVPENPVMAGTATGAWAVVVRAANHVRNRQHSNSVSGPDFFGLGQNTIKHLIQELPNADKLKDYVWQNFVEGGPLGGRHAAVIPALPEDFDPAGGPPPGYPDGAERWHHDGPHALPPMLAAPPPPGPMHIQHEYPGRSASGGSGEGRRVRRRDSRASNGSAAHEEEDWHAHQHAHAHAQGHRSPSQSPMHPRDAPMHPRDAPMHSRDGPIHSRDGPIHSRDGPTHPRDVPMHPRDVPMHPRDSRQERYSPSAYGQQGSEARVPAKFASILNAYPPSASERS